MNKKFFLVIIALIALLVFQIKVVIPFVTNIASSDLFLEDSGDEQNRLSASTIMTSAAYGQCNSYIENEILNNYTLTFAAKPLNVFGLGNFQYVMNADVEIMPATGMPVFKRYACLIKYHKGSDGSGLANVDNWSVEGISGLDDI